MTAREDSTTFSTADEATPLDDLDAAWRVPGHGPRLRSIRAGAEHLRERFASGPRVVSVRTLPVTTLAYPTKYAFWAAAFSPAPFVIMTHRSLLVQFFQQGEVKTLLFNPTDPVASRQAPYFKRLIEQVGEYVAFNVVIKEFKGLEDQLAELGLSTDSIDYVAFDHMHTQDLRPLMGTVDGSRSPHFRRAKLLVSRNEWRDWDDLHPMQKAWFVAEGKSGVLTDRVVLTERDLALGDGVMLLRTPGHTSGNQTLFVNTSAGVWGCSENGTCADNWTPLESRIAGLARMCRMQDLDVILNANTPELGAEQYTSMILERTLVDRVERAPGFCQMFPSSEVTPSPLSPGLKPTIVHEELTFGDVTAAARPATDATRTALDAATAP